MLLLDSLASSALQTNASFTGVALTQKPGNKGPVTLKDPVALTLETVEAHAVHTNT